MNARKQVGRVTPALAALALVLGFGAGCEDASGPEMGSELNADVAMVAADASLESVAFMAIPDLSHLSWPFSRVRTVTYYDADGNEQPGFDRETTESIRVQVDVSRSVERDGWSASVERVRDFTISGLLGRETTRTFNGTFHSSIERSRHIEGTTVRQYTMEDDAVIEDVVVPVPGSTDSPWPLSGTIAHTVKVTATRGDETRTFERVVVITFNGTRYPEMTVNGEPFELDLGAGPHRRPVHSRHGHGGHGRR